MSDSKQAHPAAETPDPEIEDLLKFEPAPQKIKRPNGWTPALQRRFIAKLAELGSPAKAAGALGRCRFGVEKVYRAEGAEGFRAAWDKAIEIAEERIAAQREAERAQWIGVRPPGGLDKRMSRAAPKAACPQCGRSNSSVEDEAAAREAEEAKASVLKKIDRLRRKELMEMRDDVAKRQAYEVLNGPVDWDNIRTYSLFSK